MNDFEGRWVVKSEYFGTITPSVTTVCACQSIFDCKYIIDCLCVYQKGRPFIFKAEKIALDYKPEFDDVTYLDLFGQTVSHQKYVDGVKSL